MEENVSRRIVLASTSPRRQELMSSLRLPFEIMPSDADEETPGGWAPERIVETLALRKAEAVHSKLPDDRRGVVIVGSDTIVVLGDAILGKPEHEEDAFRMLSMLQGNTHQVYTGVACMDAGTGESLVKHRVTTVHMKPLNAEQIWSYIRSGEPADKAGAYGIQGLGGSIVDHIEGDFFNVVGLPLSLLVDMLSEMGIQVLG